ncbi:hypothetical protein MBLNU459_g3301t1 [Dothideomycetes sp. NU459]
MSEPDTQTATIEAALRDLIGTYHDLNANVIDELYEEPSALEFMQYVARNRPFVVRRGAESWNAVRKWDSDYLVDVVGDCRVNVAITPHGNADAILEHDDGSLSFVKPLETQERFSEVLQYVHSQELSSSAPPETPIRYAQTQNDNLRNEYHALFADVPPSIPFARIALGNNPVEAINFWLGNSHSTTALHKDNYENIYVQVRGSKHFVLLPPVAAAGVNEQTLPARTYTVPGPDAHPIRKADLAATLDEPPERVPVATWDPDAPAARATSYSGLVKPMRVTLEQGDMLYLPALWYHKVSQSCGAEGFCCAVNYWYDMDFAGGFWAQNAFGRNIAKLAANLEGF